MKRLLLLCALAGGCARGASYVHSDTTLGRVVVYRNGVAYFERTSTVEGGELRLAVPADKVDDFLKSLTVVDAQTGRPAPIDYPTAPPGSSTGLIDMKIHLAGRAPHRLRLSYVTEAPSWKPSYRVVLGPRGQVELQAWAVIDNTSGEDWERVRLGVGSSSALSFRFDLRSVRSVQRERLEPDGLFAQAPPTGRVADGAADPAGRLLGELGDDALALAAPRDEPEERPMAGSAAAPRPRASRRPRPAPVASPASPRPSPSPLAAVASRLGATRGPIVVEGYAASAERDQLRASLDRANRVREELIRSGVPPERVVAVGNGAKPGRAAGVRIVEATPPPQAGAEAGKDGGARAGAEATDPIGTSHFESGEAVSVRRGMSAMVSILQGRTAGQVVYLYDPESPRGSATFAYKAVRLHNPTDSVLESGPMTVFGEGRFIGEGLAEPIPARATAFVPFALDRQILVERKEDGREEIARLITVQRGVFSSELRQTRRSTLTLHNRLDQPAVVYVRHSVPAGFQLAKAPAARERLGASWLFRVEVPARAASDVVIEETTPVVKAMDLRSPEALELVQAYLSSATLEGGLRDAVARLLALHRAVADLELHIASRREQMDEYRVRMDELHGQIVTLRAVRTAGPLMRTLERKLGEISDKVSAGTLDLVTLQEQLMVARVHFQDGVAELSLDARPPSAPTAGR